MNVPEQRVEGKLELISVAKELMPKGHPDFLGVVKYPKITDMVKSEGSGNVLLFVSVLVRDFCGSLNVVRNMNEDQIIEAASMLVDECDNFRLEDYVMMFAMAKKGQLVKIMDRIDLQIITEIMNAYWTSRSRAAKDPVEAEVKHLDSLGRTLRVMDDMNPMEAKLIQSGDNLAAAIGEMKHAFSAWKKD